MAFNWRCPFCNHAQTVVDAKARFEWTQVGHPSSAHGQFGLFLKSITCANEKCKEVALTGSLYTIPSNYIYGSGDIVKTMSPTDVLASGGKRISHWELRPDSHARVLPSFIPEHIRQDYEEACKIVGLSANAAAAMARRCLQNMIRDFCGVSRRTLNAEINELKSLRDNGRLPPQVQPDTVEPIDHLRQVGNFGAHMDEEPNVLLNVIAPEAKALIAVLEVLFDEWYIAREERQKRLAAIAPALAAKNAIKKAAPEMAPNPSGEPT